MKKHPSVYVALVEAILALLVTFNLDKLSPDNATNILAVAVAAGGLVTAFAVDGPALAALTGFGRAVLLLLVSYGLDLTHDQVGLAAGIIAAAGAVFLWPKVSPVPTAISEPNVPSPARP